MTKTLKYSIYQEWYNIPFLDSKDTSMTLEGARAKAIRVLSRTKKWDDMMILSIDGEGNTREVGWVLGKSYTDGIGYVWESTKNKKRYLLDKDGRNTRKIISR